MDDTVSGVAGASQQNALEQTGSSSVSAREKVLPLPGWLVKIYFIFPVILYIPDSIFNYYVYSDGWNATTASPLLQVGKVALVSFLSIGVVGMAYLLSVLAPWHWGQGHRIQAFFCALGVVIATAITTWNSLAYRSGSFVEFKTDQWAYNAWPELQTNGISITMLVVSLAPPFWGLFWAIVQPTETGRSLRQLQESHAERLMRVQHEAEVKRLKAETNAKVREAQLRGMARTATAAREQAAEVLRRKKSGEGETGEQPELVTADSATSAQSTTTDDIDKDKDSSARSYQFEPPATSDAGSGRFHGLTRPSLDGVLGDTDAGSSESDPISSLSATMTRLSNQQRATRTRQKQRA